MIRHEVNQIPKIMFSYLTLTGTGPWGSVSTVSESEELGGLAFLFLEYSELSRNYFLFTDLMYFFIFGRV
jgi:hypothetical protein